MRASFNVNPCVTTFSCYSSINANDGTNIIIFHNELFSLVQYIPKHNVLIIGGDMNAQICKGGNNKFCWHNSLNKSKVKLETVVDGDPKALFSIATTPSVVEGATPSSWLLHFILDTYLCAEC